MPFSEDKKLLVANYNGVLLLPGGSIDNNETQEEALLWTDSRYWLAAEKILHKNGYKLMKSGDSSTPSITEWLIANLEYGECVAIDFIVATTTIDNITLCIDDSHLWSCGFRGIWYER